jgi:hypothetical protein
VPTQGKTQTPDFSGDDPQSLRIRQTAGFLPFGNCANHVLRSLSFGLALRWLAFGGFSVNSSSRPSKLELLLKEDTPIQHLLLEI